MRLNPHNPCARQYVPAERSGRIEMLLTLTSIKAALMERTWTIERLYPIPRNESKRASFPSLTPPICPFLFGADFSIDTSHRENDNRPAFHTPYSAFRTGLSQQMGSHDGRCWIWKNISDRHVKKSRTCLVSLISCIVRINH